MHNKPVAVWKKVTLSILIHTYQHTTNYYLTLTNQFMKRIGLRIAVPVAALALVCGFSGTAPLSAQTVSTETGTSNKVNVYRGVVIDDEGEPLPGVTVSIVGKQGLATATDEDGQFSIRYEKPKCTLKFSYIGMKDQEVRANANKRVTVRLENDATVLQEVVANGIYTRNIESFTGSVSTFNADQLKTIAPQGILRSLSILDPSVILTDNITDGSNPNKLADISINGKTNVQALSAEYETDPNQPLFILDGFETTLQTISDLNMDRVESISILKDASATAIYGSKAANGVIVVETKKPSAGRLNLSYSGSLEVAWADLSDYNLMNAREKLEFELLAGVYDGTKGTSGKFGLDEDGLPIDETLRAAYFDRLRMIEQGHDTYWMSVPLRTAITQNHNLYLDGGDESFRYGAGLSYGKTEGVMKNSDRDVLNGNIMLQYRVDKFNFTNQLTINNTNANNETVPFSSFAQMNPFYSMYNDNGEIPKYVYRQSASMTPIWNPMWDFTQSSFNKNSSTTITENFQFEWRVTRGLRLRGSLQYSTAKNTSEIFVSPDETQEAMKTTSEKGSYTNGHSVINRYSGRINGTYGTVWGGVHTFNAVGGVQFSENNSKSTGYTVRGYSSDFFFSPNFSSGFTSGSKPTYTDSKSRSVSLYTNINYAYDMRYLLDFNLSRNGASQFGIDDPYTDTWSVGAGWNVHNEHWFKQNDIVSYLKLHASYGNPGNQNYDAKLASSIYTYSSNYTNPFGLAAWVSQWGNSGLKWQKTKTYNVGMTATTIKQKLSFYVDYQIRKSDPQLVRIQLPTSTGVTSAPMNVGGTDNRSISVNATYYIIHKGDFNWYVSGNINHNQTKYYGIGNSLEQYNKEGQENASYTSQSLMRMYDGASTTGLYVVRSAGIDPATGNEVYIRKDGKYTFEYSTDDEVLFGDTNPKFSGSFSTSFLYKGFSAGAAFTYKSGGSVFLSTLMEKIENISSNSLQYNQDRRALTDRWKQPGDIAKYKRIDDQSLSHKTSRFIAKEHTLQCASINVGYRTTTWPLLRTMGMTSIDIRAYMNDIFRISNIKEERGLSYPFQRSFSMSLGLSF